MLYLCLNAIEAMGPGGEFTARVADLSEAGSTTLLATIFNPFVTTAICRSITDAHHARFGARNNIGRSGSTFTIEFPVPVGAAARIKT